MQWIFPPRSRRSIKVSLALSAALTLQAPLAQQAVAFEPPTWHSAYEDQQSLPQSDWPFVYATEWGLTLKGDGSGYFNDLAHLILTPELGRFSYEVQPYKRAVRQFVKTTTGCLYPTTAEFLRESQYTAAAAELIESKSIQQHIIVLFSRPNTPVIQKLEELSGKNIGYAMGTRIQMYFGDIQAAFFAISDELNKAEMLLSGRLDIITAAMPDAKFVFERLGAELPPYSPDLYLKRSELKVVCKATPENMAFIERLNKRITTLWKSGEMAQFLASKGLETGLYQPGWVTSTSAATAKDTPSN